MCLHTQMHTHARANCCHLLLQIRTAKGLKGNKAAQPALLHSMTYSLNGDVINEDGAGVRNIRAPPTDQDMKHGSPVLAAIDDDSMTIDAEEQPSQASSTLNAISCTGDHGIAQDAEVPGTRMHTCVHTNTRAPPHAYSM